MAYLTLKRRSVFILLFISLFLLVGFLYNQNKEAAAQEGEIWCEDPEIPVGLSIDQALDFSFKLSANLQALLASSIDQTRTAESLLNLADQCQAGNCNTSCDQICAETDDDGICIDWECEISSCAGEPCPSGEISAQFQAVEQSYQQIKNRKRAIDDLLDKKEDYDKKPFCPSVCGELTKRELILQLLEESRKGLGNCVTPAGVYEAGSAIQEIEILYSCQEARYLGILTNQQDRCYPNNFFCCYP